MKILGIYGSPREAGNSDILLDEALKGAKSAGAEITTIRCCDLQISGCIECAGCDDTGECIVEDDMVSVYPRLMEADAIILASPMFFYSVTAQAKALIDRCQAMWCRRLLDKTPAQRRILDNGRGYMICVGATKGANLFQGAELVAKYFYDALGMTYEGGVFVKKVEAKGDVMKHPEALSQAFDLGKKIASSEGSEANE